MKYIIYYLGILIILFSCQYPTNEKSIVVDINNTSPISPEILFSSARIIPLETTEESLIAEIDKILIHEEKIYILDSRQNIVFVFNIDGHFLFKIDKKGRGPEEYNFLYDIAINPYNQSLELLDPMGNFLAYDLNGRFIQKQRLPSELPAYHKFALLNRDSIVFCSEFDENILNIYSRKTNKVIPCNLKHDRKYSIGNTSLYTYKDSTYFSRFLFDQVYYLKNEKLQIAYEWYFSGYDYDPLKTIPDYNRNNIQEFKDVADNLPYTYSQHVQNKYYLYTRIQLAGYKHSINVFHKKSTHENFVFEEFVGGLKFVSEYMNDNITINTIYTSDIENYQNLKILDAQSLKTINNYDKNLNPLLIEYKFKQ